MDWMRLISPWALLGSWVLFSGMLAWNHMRVRRERRRRGIPEEKPAIRDVRSMYGLAIEGVAFFVAFAFRQSPGDVALWRHAVSIAAGALSALILAAALRQLDLQWRIKAVVTEDHRLITTGPYALVRHPVFLSLLLLLAATVSLLTAPLAALAALAICGWGTEIRIRAEDGLLERRFGDVYAAYRKRVSAVIPGVR
jgi:protein-S-isoprenylcysteine O-methyltransferase Ste14